MNTDKLNGNGNAAFVLGQIARSGLIIDDKVVADILAGNPPPIEIVVNELVIRALDAKAFVENDKTSTWNERRIAIQCLAIAFLAALACTKDDASRPERSDGSLRG